MNYITFTPCLKKKYATDNFGIINIRITKDRKSKYISLKISLKEKDWNKNKNEVRQSFNDFERINKIICEKIKELDGIKNTNDITDIIQTSNGDEVSFMKYLQIYKNMLIERKKFGTYKKFQSTYIHLENYLQKNDKDDLKFIEINKLFIRDFETHLLTAL